MKAFNKGGFLSPSNNDIFNNNKFSGGGDREKKIFSSTIIPLTIKMLNDSVSESRDDNINVDNCKIDQIVLCGRIMDIQEESSRRVLTLNDETGEIKFIVYCKSQVDLPPYYLNCNPNEKMYVNVMITITNYQDKKIFICQRMDEIKDFNEMTNHILNVIHRSLARRYPNFENEDKENNVQPMKNKNQINQASDNYSNLDSEKMIANIFNQSNADDEKIYEVIKFLSNGKGNFGVTGDQITKAIQGKIDPRKIKIVLNKLLQDGYVFSNGDKYNIYE